ncbi:uncharacterized protein LOC122386441 isoform X2 [Amphibalanus amphitrite]|uniref:uncharacterized protein LOC122386441 isoform X2 n=1 Tax=Amphibalanus amphitrite TaxID=1232801 RepID=UPI001C92153D|nr:uncharacterized protein LOC122386441 isoform X2 [Amphibalanus amphitrite]
MEVIEGTKKRRISHEGYFYTQDSARGDTIYMKCSQKTSKSCKGRAVVENGVVTPTKSHSHAPNPSIIERAKARAEMKKRAMETVEPISVICVEAEMGMSRAARTDMPKAADSRRNVRRYRTQAHGTPAQPLTADELELREDDCFTIGRPGCPPENFLIYDSRDEPGPRMLIFASDWGLRNLSQSPHWGADGTFQVAPGIFTQLYTVHATVHDRIVPCAYALLPNKSRNTYVRMFLALRERLLLRYPGTDLTGTVITDLEMAALQAFEEVFPEKERSLCFFHFSQAVWRKTQELGLARLYATDADFALMVGYLHFSFLTSTLFMISQHTPSPRSFSSLTLTGTGHFASFDGTRGGGLV